MGLSNIKDRALCKVIICMHAMICQNVMFVQERKSFPFLLKREDNTILHCAASRLFVSTVIGSLTIVKTAIVMP